MDKFCGKRLDGRYEIREVIGFGGMAVVYKAYDLSMQCEVAIKILKDEYVNNDELRRRFRNEAKAITVLNHPNIVKVFDVGLGETVQYIVMEYIYGITLKEYIAQQHTVYWKEALHFIMQVLHALQHAHDNGIIHRDIKPQNIMLTPSGTIKVMDFGIARFQRDANGRTMAGNKAVGSVHYISPEQARGGENTDPRSDLYSVGVMLYEMLTGSVPFDGDTPVSIAMQHIRNEAKPARELNEQIPKGLEEIVTRAMQKDPDLRYQSAAEMLKDLDEFKRNPNVEFGYQYLEADCKTEIESEESQEEMKTGEKAKKKTAVKTENDKKRSYLMPILCGIAAACVIVAGVAVGIFFKGLGNRPGETRLPDLTGISVEEAAEQYPKFKFIIVAEESSLNYEAGIILETNPEAGTSVKESAEIKLTISNGLQELVMPDLRNINQQDAIDKLTDMGISSDNITVIQKFDESVSEGKIISTTPANGENITLNDSITLFVSMGESQQTVVVPDVVGLKESDARAKLSDFTVMTVMVPSDKEAGTVVEQSLTKGSVVAKGSTITLNLSNGEAPNYTVGVTVQFPGDADDSTYTFTGVLDGKEVDTKKANPSENSSMQFSLNGSKQDSVFKVYVTVNGSKQLYATYKINFIEETASLQGTINGDLVMSKIEEHTVNVSVPIPAGAKHEQVVFDIYADGIPVSKKNIVPSTTREFTVSCTGTGVGMVSVMVNGATYIEYTVNYDQQTVSILSGPNESLVMGSPEESSSEETSSEETSSEESSDRSEEEDN